MKNTTLHSILLFLMIFNALGQKQPQSFEAGTPITLKFNQLTQPTAMYCSNSFSNTLVQPTIKKDYIYYKIPEFITKKSGWVYWELTKENKNLNGLIKINPVNFTDQIEVYLGPPSIQSGFDDHSMLVTMPIDSLNNPLPPKTKVKIKKSLNGNESSSIIETDGLYAYQNIFGSTKAGRALISAECLILNSKELSLEILPGPPINFTIDYKRIHNYADGNQTTEFYTSVLKDMFGNTVSDGTLVYFNIINKYGTLLQAQGVTIRGIATCQMVHPDHEENWTVHAYVDKFSQSNSIEINYKKAVNDFYVWYNQDKKTVEVGPFKSFMKQVLPDGLVVNFSLYHQKTLVKKYTTQSEKGFAYFNISNFLKNNTAYTLWVEAAEIRKKIQIQN